jgi:hypothetical protein
VATTGTVETIPADSEVVAVRKIVIHVKISRLPTVILRKRVLRIRGILRLRIRGVMRLRIRVIMSMMGVITRLKGAVILKTMLKGTVILKRMLKGTAL